MTLIAELKRRNIFRVGGAYLVVGWLMIQVASTVAPQLNIPDWVPRVVTLFVLLGFPVALLLAWALELTPEGIKLDARGTGGKRVFALAILLIAGVLAWHFRSALFTQSRSPDAPTTVQSTGAAPPQEQKAAPAAPAAALASATSIVVLPFADMSASKDQEYLSDGLAEELLNLLAKIPELAVISRSTAFSFKGKSLDVPTIAKQLGVSHVLEGSVRKAGNQVRVTVQLIAAHSDTHLWSQTYDRPLDDIFAIEDQISAAVVEQLKVQLLGNVPKATATNPEAYALTLRARQQYQAGTPEGVVASVALFRQAIEIAPDYAPAWGALAVAYSFEAARALRPVAEAVPLARAAAQHALALAPDLAIAHAILGSIAHTYDRDLPAAAAHLERAMLLGPRDSDVLRFAAQVAQGLGRKAQALALAEANVRLDPANPHARTALGRIQRISGHLDDSIESFRRALAESPRLNALHHYLTIVLLLRHRDNADLEAAQREALAEPEGGYRTVAVALAEFALGHRAESDAALAIAVREHERDASYNIAYAYAYRHEADAAFTWLDKAVAYNDSGLNELATQALFAPIHADPRWRQLLERLKRTPEELAAIPFDVAVPTGLPSAGPQQ